jgi:hypothetical protein
METVHLSRRGTVVTCTVIHVAPAEFAMETPYAVAVVETPEGARLMAQVTDANLANVRPGLPVSLEFRLIRQEGHGGILCYGHKAVPEVSDA